MIRGDKLLYSLIMHQSLDKRIYRLFCIFTIKLDTFFELYSFIKCNILDVTQNFASISLL